MNELTIETRTPIEIALDIDNEGMTTAKKLYAFLELDKSHYSRWCKVNIIDNEFAEQNVDYFYSPSKADCMNPRVSDDFKITSHFAKKLAQKANCPRGEEAREYFTRLEERVKEKAMAEQQSLSPELKMFELIFESQKKLAYENTKAQQMATTAINSAGNTARRMDEMKEIFSGKFYSSDDWRERTVERIRTLAYKNHIKGSVNYASFTDSLYNELPGVDLDRRIKNRKERMMRNGSTQSAINSECTKIAIIAESPQLRALFNTILQKHEMALV